MTQFTTIDLSGAMPDTWKPTEDRQAPTAWLNKINNYVAEAANKRFE